MISNTLPNLFLKKVGKNLTGLCTALKNKETTVRISDDMVNRREN